MTSKLTCKDKSKSKAHTQDSIPSFIRKTYDILEERKFPEIIDWNPEGTALVIKKPSEFCQKVLPTYFKHNNLTSFVRQLNMYNFHKRRTQNIDHVYYHELFQRGKKHLLKEIKRKNHEHTADKGLKSPETSETSQSQRDVPSLCYENQILKRLYNDAMSKITALEGQVKDLTAQNQSLWSQVCAGNQEETSKPFMTQAELTQEQLPMTFSDISIPPLKLGAVDNSSSQITIQGPFPCVKNQSITINGYFNEDSGESTEDSHNSPSLQPSMESEKCFDMTESTPLTTCADSNYTLSVLSLTPQVSGFPQVQPPKSYDLFASRSEMSVGKIFESWNSDLQQIESKESGLLGKRQLETDNVSALFQVPEPSNKRQQDCNLFVKKGLISTGTEDKEFFRSMLGRNNSECEQNMNFDLMDFNTAPSAWTKAT